MSAGTEGSAADTLRCSLDYCSGISGWYVFLLSGVLYFIMQSPCCFLWCLGNWDIDGRVNILKQWDIRRSLCFLNHKHLSLHFYSRNVLFEILLGCGKDLLLVAAAFAC